MDKAHSIAYALDTLFRSVRRADGQEYSHREVDRYVTNYLGHRVSDVYIGQLRRGDATDPRKSVMLGLARFFRVEPTYFMTSENLAPPADGHASHETDGSPGVEAGPAPALLMRMNQLDEQERRILAQTLELLERRRNQ